MAHPDLEVTRRYPELGGTVAYAYESLTADSVMNCSSILGPHADHVSMLGPEYEE
jgi:2-oxo-4-hydroxy-4-carboxy--5-ureidoimidazoline (OHCU) decarboxylase